MAIPGSQNSLGAGRCLTGKPLIWGTAARHLAGRAAAISVIPTKNDIIIILLAKLKDDVMPDTLDESLSEEII